MNAPDHPLLHRVAELEGLLAQRDARIAAMERSAAIAVTGHLRLLDRVLELERLVRRGARRGAPSPARAREFSDAELIAILNRASGAAGCETPPLTLPRVLAAMRAAQKEV